jgi:hypothetical protein
MDDDEDFPDLEGSQLSKKAVEVIISQTLKALNIKAVNVSA